MKALLVGSHYTLYCFFFVLGKVCLCVCGTLSAKGCGILGGSTCFILYCALTFLLATLLAASCVGQEVGQ